MTQSIEEMRSTVKKMGHMPRGQALVLIERLEEAITSLKIVVEERDKLIDSLLWLDPTYDFTTHTPTAKRRQQ